MLLVADSGSTKTEWVLAEQGKPRLRVRTTGYNPYFIDTDGIIASLKSELTGTIDLEAVNELYFYGAGCGTPEKLETVGKAMRSCFPNASVTVNHDLLGAARALLGNERGFAAILGTGTNSCIYDGSDIEVNIDSLGYLLGDEGSGAYIGRLVLSSRMRGYLPPELDKAFSEKYALAYKDILDTLYNKPFPNRFLAGFCDFAAEHGQHPFIISLVKEAFEAFFNKLVTHYPGYREHSLNCVGSVAAGFSEALSEVAASHRMKTGRIIKSAVDALVDFHLQ